MKHKTVEDDRPIIKLQLDGRTVVKVRSWEAVKYWKKRYPLLKIIS